MILGIGADLVDLDRFRAVLERRPGMIARLFTDAEREYSERRNDSVERYAVRFAAKEAVLKSMGVGMGAADWHDIEVARDDSGRPSLIIRGRAAQLASSLGIARWELTLTHSDLVAQAIVVAHSGYSELSGAFSSSRSFRSSRSLAASGPTASGPTATGPIVTPAEMAAIDRAAPESVDVLISRAGSAVARAAIRMMGGTYGRRVVVVAGKGNNGNDGRDAAVKLRARGVRVIVIDAASAPETLPTCDLVIDAAYGTGFAGTYDAPVPCAGSLVLAVDIPSGIDGLTGIANGRVLHADETVTFAALKPGLLFADGIELSGRCRVADIGLSVEGGSPRADLIGSHFVSRWLPDRLLHSNKWESALWIVAGSPGMGGAASLCSAAAARTGAGYVRVSTPGGVASDLPLESVRVDIPPVGWAPEVVAGLNRFGALVIGNGLGTTDEARDNIRQVVAAAAGRGLPTVVDADGLTALGTDAARFVGPTTVLTPHDREFARLAGHAPGPDRIAAARDLAATTGAVVLLKGGATVIASPDGDVLVSAEGDQRLATAGTGDVLAGIIGALLASGVDPFHAAASGAFIHGRAAALGWERGLVASDISGHLPEVLGEFATS
ncbi:putative carbohydrate kinase [Acidimicrobiia bacterium]